MSSYQEFSEDESGTDDDGELESYLYSQIHYSQSQDNEMDTVDSAQGEEQNNVGDQNENNSELGTREHSSPSLYDPCSTKASVTEITNSHVTKGPIESSKRVDNYHGDAHRHTRLVRPGSPESRVQPRDSKGQQHVVPNPLYNDGSESDTSSDDGIIVLSEPENRTITISSDDDDDDDGANFGAKDTARAVNGVARGKKRRKNDHYIAEFGSDFEDNFLSEEDSDSDSSVMVVEEDKMQINITNQVQTPAPVVSSDEEENKEWNTPKKWNTEMNLFYCSYNKENLNISIDNLGESGAPGSWRLDRADLVKASGFKSRYFTSRGKCTNCNEMGHFSRECKEPLKPIKCSMCGTQGHRDVRCPENCCLGCGQPGLGFQSSCSHCRALHDTQCKECGFTGHLRRNCPDLWRRFHQTTEVGRAPVQFDSSKQAHKHWCPNCGRKGHLIQDCRRYLYSPHPVTSQQVISYRSIAQDNSFSKRRKNRFAGERQISTCPNSPRRESVLEAAPAAAMTRSAPVTPVPGAATFINSVDLLHAVENISKKDRFKQKRREKREMSKKLKRSAERRWEVTDDSFFQTRITNGHSKREKKRQKFYNAVQRQEKGAMAKFVQRRFKGRQSSADNSRPPPASSDRNNGNKRKKQRGEGKKGRDINVQAFFKMKFRG